MMRTPILTTPTTAPGIIPGTTVTGVAATTEGTAATIVLTATTVEIVATIPVSPITEAPRTSIAVVAVRKPVSIVRVSVTPAAVAEMPADTAAVAADMAVVVVDMVAAETAGAEAIAKRVNLRH